MKLLLVGGSRHDYGEAVTKKKENMSGRMGLDSRASRLIQRF